MLAPVKPINLEESVLNLNRKAMHDLRSNHPEKSLSLLKKALSSTSPLNSCLLKYKLLSVTLNNLGLYFKSMAEYKLAASCLSEALECEKRIGEETELIASIHLNFSSILSALGQHERALRYALKTVQKLKNDTNNKKDTEKTHDNSLVVAYHSSGIEYEYLNMPADAIQCYQTGHSYAAKNLGINHDTTKAIRRSLDILQCKLAITSKSNTYNSIDHQHGRLKTTQEAKLKKEFTKKHSRSKNQDNLSQNGRKLNIVRRFSNPINRSHDTETKSSPLYKRGRDYKGELNKKEDRYQTQKNHDHSEMNFNKTNNTRNRLEQNTESIALSSSIRHHSHKDRNPISRAYKNLHVKTNSQNTGSGETNLRKKQNKTDKKGEIVSRSPYKQDNFEGELSLGNFGDSFDCYPRKYTGYEVGSTKSHHLNQDKLNNWKQFSRPERQLSNSSKQPFSTKAKIGKNLYSDNAKYKKRLNLNLMIPAAVTIQAWWKGVLTRKKYGKACIERKIKITKLSIRNAEKKLVQLRKEKDKLEGRKSPKLIRNTYKYKLPYGKLINSVIRIQRFIRNRAKSMHKSQKQYLNIEK